MNLLFLKKLQNRVLLSFCGAVFLLATNVSASIVLNWNPKVNTQEFGLQVINHIEKILENSVIDGIFSTKNQTWKLPSNIGVQLSKKDKLPETYDHFATHSTSLSKFRYYNPISLKKEPVDETLIETQKTRLAEVKETVLTLGNFHEHSVIKFKIEDKNAFLLMKKVSNLDGLEIKYILNGEKENELELSHLADQPVLVIHPKEDKESSLAISVGQLEFVLNTPGHYGKAGVTLFSSGRPATTGSGYSFAEDFKPIFNKVSSYLDQYCESFEQDAQTIFKENLSQLSSKLGLVAKKIFIVHDLSTEKEKQQLIKISKYLRSAGVDLVIDLVHLQGNQDHDEFLNKITLPSVTTIVLIGSGGWKTKPNQSTEALVMRAQREKIDPIPFLIWGDLDEANAFSSALLNLKNHKSIQVSFTGQKIELCTLIEKTYELIRTIYGIKFVQAIDKAETKLHLKLDTIAQNEELLKKIKNSYDFEKAQSEQRIQATIDKFLKKL